MWTFSANASGNVSFTGTVASLGVTSTTGTSNAVAIQTKPAITVSYVGMVTPVSVGQEITVVVQVANTGEAQINNVLPVLIGQGDTASINNVASPVAQNIAGGSSATYTWRYATSANGVVSFYGTASGTDANSGEVISATPATSSDVTIEEPAALTTMLYAPGTVSRGQLYTVTMVVSNTGAAGATGVAPSALVFSGTGTKMRGVDSGARAGGDLVNAFYGPMQAHAVAGLDEHEIPMCKAGNEAVGGFLRCFAGEKSFRQVQSGCKRRRMLSHVKDAARI